MFTDTLGHPDDDYTIDYWPEDDLEVEAMKRCDEIIGWNDNAVSDDIVHGVVD